MLPVTLRRRPRVLFLSAWDGEDYGAQWAYDGLCALLGWQNVIEWPFNPYHHLPMTQPRQYDSELYWPRQFWDECQIRDLLRSGTIDLVVVSSARQVATGTLRQLKPWLATVNAIAVLDMEDAPALSAYEIVRDLSAAKLPIRAVFKREWRAEHYGVTVPVLPFPFSYPRERAVAPSFKPTDGPLVFYRAHDWGWAEDSPRHQMVEALQARFGERADVGLSQEGSPRTGRLTIGEYHRRLTASRIAIALNAGGGSDNNRYWESVAHGCVLVSDRPRHEIPDNFVNEEEAFFYESIEEAVEIVARLDADPALCQRVAEAGHAKFLARHTTASRAAYLIEMLAHFTVASGCRPDWIG